jgi:hypothetical protein
MNTDRGGLADDRACTLLVTAGVGEDRASSVQDRPPGWFIDSSGKPLQGEGPDHRKPTPRWMTALRVFGFVVLVPGLYFAFAPWGDCGISVMGRYDHSSPPDLAATAFTVCWNQAQARRLLAAVLVAGGILMLITDGLVRWRRPRRST